MKEILLIGMIWAQSEDLPEVERFCIACHEESLEEARGSFHFAKRVYCTGCHGMDEVVEGKHRFLATFKGRIKGVQRGAKIDTFCGSCHEVERIQFERGAHFRATQAEKMAGCLSCHEYHATEYADRTRILNSSCISCHDKTKEWDDGNGIVASLNRVEGELLRLSSRLQGLRSVPGEDFGTEKVASQAFLERVADLRRVQHAMRVGEVVKDAGDVSGRLAATGSGLESKEVAVRRRPIWIVLFLGGVGLVGILVRVKFRQGVLR